ncbi:MAG: Asp-tRNA(Asn)/Glu-tRNA(Gln) amidotransferase subunit GatB [Ferruginibacter sp.]
MINNKYQTVIGLEVHAQLSTKSKLFSGDSISFGADANTHVSPISLAHPGTLPVMNETVLQLAIKLGLALNCTIEKQNYFARKNYFYPDLPKGYQVSQHTAPICNGGYLPIQTINGKKNVKLNRIHMEEDAGKSIHDLFENYSAIDLNRAGTPLLEIVTEPDLNSADEVYTYLTEMRKLLRWLNVCDGNMEEGSMRCDANISVRLHGDTKLGTRVEVKNLNSIRNVKKAIEIEVARLITLTENGEKITQETRSYNADNNTTFSLRSKEEADDYRYFPEPDLPPFVISESYIQNVEAQMPALPAILQEKYVTEFNLSAYDAAMLCADKEDTILFEAVSSITGNYKSTANWITGPIKNYCNEHNITLKDFPLNAIKIADIINFTDTGKIHFNVASTKLMEAMIVEKIPSAETLATVMNLKQESNFDTLENWANDVLISMPDKVKEYKAGKKGLIGLFAGQVKKLSGGKADMETVTKILEEKLSSSN